MGWLVDLDDGCLKDVLGWAIPTLFLPPGPNVADVTRKQRPEIISTRAAVKLGLIGTEAMWRSSHQIERKSGMTLNQAPATAIPRPLGATEKLFWRADQDRPTHFAIAAEVGGSTRIEQWRARAGRGCPAAGPGGCGSGPHQR